MVLGWQPKPSIFGTSRATSRSLTFSSSLRADGLMSRTCLATQTTAFDQIGFDGFEGNALSPTSLFRDETVVEILPERPMLAKVDLHADLAALLHTPEIQYRSLCPPPS